MARCAPDRISCSFRAVMTCRATQTVTLVNGAILVKVSAGGTLVGSFGASGAPMARWAISGRQVSDGVVSTVIAFRALRALILEDSFLPRVVCARRALILVLLVDELVADNRAPMTLFTRPVVVVTPWADVSWLAATAVSNLTLSRLYAHCFVWALSWVKGSLWTVVTLGTLIDRRVRPCVETLAASIASDTLIDNDTCSTVLGCGTNLTRSIACVGCTLVHTRWANGLAFGAQFTF